MSAKQIPVYRKHQPTLKSPCLLGNPCSVCKEHVRCLTGDPCRGCRRGKFANCELSTPTEPAFTVTRSRALVLIRHGLADFIMRQTALRLTFSNFAHLRDYSLRIDEQFLINYASGEKREIAVIENGWRGYAIAPLITWTYEQKQASMVNPPSFR